MQLWHIAFVAIGVTSDLRPVETELAEMYEMDEGLREANFTAPQGAGFKGRQEQQNFMNSRPVIKVILIISS